MVAIVAGSKVSTKLDVLNSLSGICDQLIVGGGIANTFLAAAGYNVGKSLYEADLVETAKQIAAKVSVPLPTDVVVADASQINFEDFLGSLAAAQAVIKKVEDVTANDMILDVGPETAKAFANILTTSKRFFGMVLLVYLKLINLVRVLKHFLLQLHNLMHSQLLVVVIL